MADVTRGSLIEHTARCLNPACRLRWIVFGGKPDKVCPYCGSPLTREERTDA